MFGVRQQFVRLIPFLFVLLWSTGFIGAKYGLPYIEPFNMLFLRVLITLVVFLGLIFILKSRWLSFAEVIHQMLSGSLIHAAYLGGVFAAIKWGMPAGVTAIIVGLQPLLTSFIGRLWLQQALSWLQIVGLFCGLIGVVAVLAGSGTMEQGELALKPMLAAIVALIGISLGTLYQKRFCAGVDLVTGSFFQYLATAILMGLLTYSTETGEIIWSGQLIFALCWLVFGLSVAAILLLMYMIREGEAAKVASYFYLVPPVAALEAWLLFDEAMNLYSLAGVIVTVAGVYLVLKYPVTVKIKN